MRRHRSNDVALLRWTVFTVFDLSPAPLPKATFAPSVADRMSPLNKTRPLANLFQLIFLASCEKVLFFHTKRPARNLFTAMGRRISKSARQFRVTVSIDCRMTHETGFGFICITFFAWAIASSCKRTVADRRQSAFIPVIGNCTPRAIHE